MKVVFNFNTEFIPVIILGSSFSYLPTLVKRLDLISYFKSFNLFRSSWILKSSYLYILIFDVSLFSSSELRNYSKRLERCFLFSLIGWNWLIFYPIINRFWIWRFLDILFILLSSYCSRSLISYILCNFN